MSELYHPPRPPYCNGCDAPCSAGFPTVSAADTCHALIETLFQKFQQQQLEQQHWIQSTLASSLKAITDMVQQKIITAPSIGHTLSVQQSTVNVRRQESTQSQSDVMKKFWDRFDDNERSVSSSEIRKLVKTQEAESPSVQEGVHRPGTSLDPIPQGTESTLGFERSNDKTRTPSGTNNALYTSESQNSVSSKAKRKDKASLTIESLPSRQCIERKSGLQSLFHEHGYRLSDVIEDVTNGVNVETKYVKMSWRAFCRATFPLGTILETMMGLIVALDCAAIGIKNERAHDMKYWMLWDTAVALVFFIERTVLLMVSGWRKHYCGPSARWNIFETLLVLLMVSEVGLQLLVAEHVNESLLTLLRLLRLGRFVRILRLSRLSIFSDLLMLLTGAAGGLRTLMWSILLVSVPIYMVSLILTGSLEPVEERQIDDASKYFSNLPESFFTMFRCVVAQECTDEKGRPIFLLLTASYGWQYGAIYCITHILMTFGLFNVIVAIYVENTVAAAKTNETQKRRARLMDNRYFTKKTKEMVEFVYRVLQLGEGFDGNEAKEDLRGELCFADKLKLEITPEGFAELRQFKEFQDLLRDLDIADESQLDFFKTLDVDGGGTIDLEELIAGLTLLRGDARRSDIVGVALVVRSMQAMLNHFESTTTQQLRSQAQELSSLKMSLKAPGRESSSSASMRGLKSDLSASGSFEDP